MSRQLLQKPQHTTSVAPKRAAAPERATRTSTTDISPGNPSRAREQRMWDNMRAGARSQGENSQSQNTQSPKVPIQTALQPRSSSHAAEVRACQQGVVFDSQQSGMTPPQELLRRCTQLGEWQLTGEEIAYAREVFGDSIDYNKIIITIDHPLSAGASKTIGDTIYLQSMWGRDPVLERDGRTLTRKGKELLIHEMTHVWQFQNGGLGYIADSLRHQAEAWIRGGDRNAAYNWEDAADDNIDWRQWTAEQQAAAIEEYNRVMRRIAEGRGSKEDFKKYDILRPYQQQVVQGRGAV